MNLWLYYPASLQLSLLAKAMRTRAHLGAPVGWGEGLRGGWAEADRRGRRQAGRGVC
jgi:hypothetical protein